MQQLRKSNYRWYYFILAHCIACKSHLLRHNSIYTKQSQFTFYENHPKLHFCDPIYMFFKFKSPNLHFQNVSAMQIKSSLPDVLFIFIMKSTYNMHLNLIVAIESRKCKRDVLYMSIVFQYRRLKCKWCRRLRNKVNFMLWGVCWGMNIQVMKLYVSFPTRFTNKRQQILREHFVF